MVHSRTELYVVYILGPQYTHIERAKAKFEPFKILLANKLTLSSTAPRWLCDNTDLPWNNNILNVF